MLMSGDGRAARLHYLPSTFRVLSNGDHVLCAITGARIPLHELRYWSVEPASKQSAGQEASSRSSKRCCVESQACRRKGQQKWSSSCLPAYLLWPSH